MNRQSRLDAGYRMLGAGALGRRRGMVQGGRREGGSGWGTRVYQWQIHVDVWQNQYNIVSNKPPIKINKFVFKKNNILESISQKDYSTESLYFLLMNFKNDQYKQN